MAFGDKLDLIYFGIKLFYHISQNHSIFLTPHCELKNCNMDIVWCRDCKTEIGWMAK